MQPAGDPGLANGLESIADKVFAECKSLRRLQIPAHLHQTSERAWVGLRQLEIRQPAAATPLPGETGDVILFPDWTRLTFEEATDFCLCVQAQDGWIAIDQTRYDQLWSQLTSLQERFAMAVVQLRCPGRLSLDRLSLYLDFMRAHAAQLMSGVIDQQDLAGCQVLLEHHC